MPVLAKIKDRPLWRQRMPAPADVPLVGEAAQTAGGVIVVDTREKLEWLREALLDQPYCGLDTEFENVDVKSGESPVLKGRIVVWSVAWPDPALGVHPKAGVPLFRRVMIHNFGEALEDDWLGQLRPWFESPDHGKVGSFFHGTDLHLFANHGIQVNGLRGDQVRKSQQLSNGKRYEHGLKPTTAEYLGYAMRDFNELFTVPKLTQKGVPYANDQRVAVPWSTIITDPRLYALLVDYASLDPKSSGEQAMYLDGELRQRPWRVEDGVELGMDEFCRRYNDPYQYVVAGMEAAGWDADAEWFARQAVKARSRCNELAADLDRWAGASVKWGSWQQKQWLMYGKGEKTIAGNKIVGKGFPVSPISKHGPCDEGELPTDKVAVQWVRDHVERKEDKAQLDRMMEWTKVDKLAGSFLEPLPTFLRDDGRIHSRIGPEAETGRLTSKKPSLQVLPVGERDPFDTREGLTCRPGEVLVGADYSQLEMRVLAHYLVMLFGQPDENGNVDESAFALANDLAAGDLHANTALRVWGDLSPRPDPLLVGLTAKDIKGHPSKLVRDFRNKGKIVNFSVNYGKTKVGLGVDIRETCTCPPEWLAAHNGLHRSTCNEGEPIGEDAAQRILDDYFNAYTAILKYHKWAKNYVRRNGYVRTLLGRYRFLPNIYAKSRGLVGKAERAALNTPIQGSAADIIMMAMLRLNPNPIPDLVRLGWFDEEMHALGAVLVMQIHDELVFRCPWRNGPAVKARMEYLMQRPFDGKTLGFPASGLPLPVDGKIGMTYREIK